MSLAKWMSLPPPRVPICLYTWTVRFLAERRGAGLLTTPERSVPCARIVTVVFAGVDPADRGTGQPRYDHRQGDHRYHQELRSHRTTSTGDLNLPLGP